MRAFKTWSSLTALGMLFSAGCSSTDTSTAVPDSASVRQATSEFAVFVDGEESAQEKLQADIDGKPISLEELTRLLGDETVESKEISAVVEGKEIAVEAWSSLGSGTLRFEGLRRILDSVSSEVDVCATFYPRDQRVRVCVLVPPTTSVEKEDPELREGLAQVEQMNRLIEELSERYPDPEKIDPDAFMEKEAPYLEKIATLYCQSSGQGVPCDPTRGEDTPNEEVKQLSGGWWYWIRHLISQVGVIPSATTCPSDYSLVQIYHDDEDRRNANHRWGWQGGISSTSNTLFRFCKVPGRNFYPLDKSGPQYNYALLKLGLFCPGGTTRTTLRGFDNEDSNNQNGSSGPIFPNVNLFGRNWVMHFCVLDGGTSSPRMSSFPSLGFSYGVFAPTNMPAPYSLQAGYVYKDDEDILNLNFWVNGPGSMMGGTNNTWFGLAKVK
jgi:hypothetical protein